jgi:fructose-specific phosphotransferase system IIC component
VAPFNFLGFAAPDRRRRAGLLGVSSAKGVTSEGESAVLEGLRVVATGRALLSGSSALAAAGFATDLVKGLVAGLLVSSVARLIAGIQELLSILQGQPYSLTI